MVVLGQIPVCASRSTARLLQLSPDSSPEWTSETDKSFKGQGYSFIDIRPAHLDFIAWVMGRQAPDFERIFGAALVNRNFIPLGVALAYFEDECVSIHAHFGKWLRVYPKDILRHMHKFCDALRAQGHTIVYAVADESIDGSDKLLEWLNAKKTDKKHEFGFVYEIDLTKAKI